MSWIGRGNRETDRRSGRVAAIAALLVAAGVAVFFFVLQGAPRGVVPVRGAPGEARPAGVEAEAEAQPAPAGGPGVVSRVVVGGEEDEGEAAEVEVARVAEIRGFVEMADRAPLPAQCSVRAVDQAGLRVIRELAVGPDGTFRVEVAVEAAPRIILLAATATDGKAHWASHPSRTRVSRNATSKFVTLKLRSGCRIEARVVDEQERPVAGATCLLTQLSQTTLDRRIPNSELDAWNTLDELLVAGASGRVTAIVREGHFLLRASRDGGVWGVPVRRLAPPAGEIDVGTIRVPARTVRLTLSVTGPGSEPLAGMWVRLADRALSFGNENESSNGIAHLFTDARGRVELTVGAALLPLRGAVGSKEFYCEEVVWSEAAPEARVELSRRPRVDLVLRSPAGDVVPMEVGWVSKWLGRRRPLDSEQPGPYTPLQVLKMLCNTQEKRLAPGVTRLTLSSPGPYRFVARPPGGLLLTAEATVKEGDQEVSVLVSGVRPVTLTLRNSPPRKVELEVRTLRRPGDPKPFTSRVVVQPGTREIVCWIPEVADGLQVRCDEPWGEWPFERPGSRSRLEIDLAADDTNCTLVAGPGDARGEQGARFVLRMRRARLRWLEADQEGAVRLRLKPGRYDVAREPLPRGTEKRGWLRFDLREHETLTVIVPPAVRR